MVQNKDAFDSESKVVKELSNLLAHHVIPIFKEASSSQPELIGSSLLIASGRDFFLISAAHVFDELKKHKLYYYIEPNIKREISGKALVTKIPEGGDRKNDRIDIGVLKIQGLGIPPYPKVGKFPLDIKALLPNALPREGKIYLIVGFPATKTRINWGTHEISSHVYSFRNISFPLGKYAELGITAKDNIAVIFNRKKVIGADKKRCMFPEPSGMSGSPLFLLYDEVGLNDPIQTPVVGVVIEHKKEDQVVIATDISFAMDAINELMRTPRTT